MLLSIPCAEVVLAPAPAPMRGRGGGLARKGSREQQAAALYSTIRRRYKECASDDDDIVTRLGAEPPTRRVGTPSASGEAVLDRSPPWRRRQKLRCGKVSEGLALPPQQWKRVELRAGACTCVSPRGCESREGPPAARGGGIWGGSRSGRAA